VGWPTPRRYGKGGPTAETVRWRLEDIIAIREGTLMGLTLVDAVQRARPDVELDAASQAHALSLALVALDGGRAGRILNNAVYPDGADVAIERVLLPAVASIADIHGYGSNLWAFSATYAIEWLRWIRAMAAASGTAPAAIVIDASAGPLTHDAILLTAFETACARAGLATTVFPADGTTDTETVVELVGPDALVVAGERATGRTAREWVRAARRAHREIPVCVFAPALDEAEANGSGTLPRVPTAAAMALRWRLVTGETGRSHKEPVMRGRSAATESAAWRMPGGNGRGGSVLRAGGVLDGTRAPAR
jgi:hypothetical protein